MGCCFKCLWSSSEPGFGGWGGFGRGLGARATPPSLLEQQRSTGARIDQNSENLGPQSYTGQA